MYLVTAFIGGQDRAQGTFEQFYDAKACAEATAACRVPVTIWGRARTLEVAPIMGIRTVDHCASHTRETDYAS